MKNQTIEQVVEEIPTNKCPVCDGDGCTVEHDPNDPTGQTPIQVQCDFCHAEGKIITLDCVREALQAQRDAGAREESKRIKSLLRGKEPSLNTDFNSKEEYQIHCQKIGAINWYSNLIRQQIDLPFTRNFLLITLTPPTK